MLKSLKLHKLKRKYEMHYAAALFCIQKQIQLTKTFSSLTTDGYAKWWKYNRRTKIHREAYEKLLKEFNMLKYGPC